MSDSTKHIAALLEPTATALGFELIRVSYGGGRKPTLQIMAEREDGTMTVDDCAILSREVSALLDVEDPLPGEYLLEVSSPGIDRPLTRPKDFERWAGFDAKIELYEVRDDRRRFRGKIIGIDGEEVTILTPEGDRVTVLFEEISKAKLLLTDDLIKAATNK